MSPAKTGRIEQRWHKFKKSNERAAQCMLVDAQFFVAREHGFSSWPKFAKHVEAMSRANTPVSKFEAAVDAIVAGDLAGLKKLLSENPDLVRARSTREHRSTLLHYVSANGVEDFRQKTPPNIVEITKALLDAGADVNAESDAYSGGSTTLGLVATSVHPERAGVQIALLETLLERGSRIDQPSAAGNGQSVVAGCLANGQPKAAKFLADQGAPLRLTGAAGLGLLDAVRDSFDNAGKSERDSAFLYACGYGRTEVVEFLIAKGVDVAVHDPGHRTGLHWAAYAVHLRVFEVLLRNGCPVDTKDDYFGATPLDMLLWTWDNTDVPAERERCYEAVALLARAGAVLDPKQWHDPNSRQPGMLDKIQADVRMLAALRGGAQ